MACRGVNIHSDQKNKSCLQKRHLNENHWILWVTPLLSLHAFPKTDLTPTCHAFSTWKPAARTNKCYSMHVCACMDHKRLESRHSWHLVMSPHNLLTSHLHPSVTHRGRIRWTASITWQCTLFLQALFQGNQIWSTQFPSSVCTYVSDFWAVVSIETRKLDLWPMKRDTVYSACRCQKNKWKKKSLFQIVTWHSKHHLHARTSHV